MLLKALLGIPLLCVPVLSITSQRSVLIIYGSQEEPEHISKWVQSRETTELYLKDIFSVKKFPSGERLIDPHGEDKYYDNIILFGSRIPKELPINEFVEFTKRGGNIAWIMPSRPSTPLDLKTQELALEFGRILNPEPAKIFDSSGNPDDKEFIPVHLWDNVEDRIIKPKDIVNLKIRAFSHVIDRNNPLVFPILSSRPEAHAFCHPTSQLVTCIPQYGADNIIASALLSRIDSRITFISSDDLFHPDETSNNALPIVGQQILSWTFKEAGVVEMTNFEHALVVDRNDDRGYRIYDKIKVKACLTKKDGPGKEAEPFQPEGLQVELIMMEPWLRFTLLPNADGCMISETIMLPQKYGVFTLKMRFQRRGWPHIIKNEQIILRPFHHDEIPRFKFFNIPYYAGWISMMVSSALLIFPLAITGNRHHN